MKDYITKHEGQIWLSYVTTFFLSLFSQWRQVFDFACTKLGLSSLFSNHPTRVGPLQFGFVCPQILAFLNMSNLWDHNYPPYQNIPNLLLVLPCIGIKLSWFHFSVMNNVYIYGSSTVNQIKFFIIYKRAYIYMCVFL